MKLIRESKGISQEAVAHDVGISTSQLSRYESGKKDPKLGELRKIAKRLDCKLSDLIDESVSGMDYIRETITVPVRGIIAAGLWFEYTDLQHETFDPIPIAPSKFPGVEQFAFRVCGPSMDKKRIFDGDYVVCVPYWDVRKQIESGDLVVIERRDGKRIERTCREIAFGPNGYEFWPRSTDARFQTPTTLPIAQDPRADDGTLVDIVGLIIMVCSPR